MGTKPAKGKAVKSVTCIRLASTLLKYTSVLHNEDPPPPPGLRSVGGPKLVNKVGPLRARAKSAKVRPTTPPGGRRRKGWVGL